MMNEYTDKGVNPAKKIEDSAKLERYNKQMDYFRRETEMRDVVKGADECLFWYKLGQLTDFSKHDKNWPKHIPKQEKELVKVLDSFYKKLVEYNAGERGHDKTLSNLSKVVVPGEFGGFITRMEIENSCSPENT